MTAPATNRGRGRPPLVDRDSVIDAAITLGFANLTMTALADALGVRHSTLYRHVGGRDQLVRDAIDRVFDTTVWPTPPDDWRQYVRDFATTLVDVYLGNPGMAAELSRILRSSDALVRALNDFRSALLDRGLSPEDTVLLSELITQLARNTSDYRRTEDGASLSEEDVRQEMRTRLEDVARGTDPRVREALIAYNANDSRRNFEAKLALIIRGIER